MARRKKSMFAGPKLTDHCEHFASISDVATAAQARAAADGGALAYNGDGHSWSYGVDFNGALELARKGWPDGARKVRALADKLISLVAPALANSGLEYRDDGGPLLDVGRYCEGEPEHYLEFAPEPARKPVTITVNLTRAWFVTADQSAMRGAAVLAAAEILAARGFVVTIDALDCVHARNADHAQCLTTYNVHAAGDVIDADALAFALGHAAFGRRLVLAIYDGMPNRETWGFTISQGYGVCREPREIPAGIYEPGMTSREAYTSEAHAAARVLEICKQAGCEIAEV